MKLLPELVLIRRALHATLICSAALASGCASDGGGQVHGSVYMGVGYYDSWGWGGCCYYGSPPVVVGPPGGNRPDVDRPVKPSQPIAKPPTSRPTPAPRPTARGGGGRRGR